MSHAFGTLDELGEGYGFRKVRQALGVEAFGVNAIVYAARTTRASTTTTTSRTSSTSSTRARRGSRSRTRCGCSARAGWCHVDVDDAALASRTRGDDDLVVLVVGGKGGYVERDGHLVDEADVERRAGSGRRAARARLRARLGAARPGCAPKHGAREREHDHREPVDADHVGLQPEHRDGRERRCEPRESAGGCDEERDEPADERREAERGPCSTPSSV